LHAADGVPGGTADAFECARFERWNQASRPVSLSQSLLGVSVPPW